MIYEKSYNDENVAEYLPEVFLCSLVNNNDAGNCLNLIKNVFEAYRIRFDLDEHNCPAQERYINLETAEDKLDQLLSENDMKDIYQWYRTFRRYDYLLYKSKS